MSPEQERKNYCGHWTRADLERTKQEKIRIRENMFRNYTSLIDELILIDDEINARNAAVEYGG